VRRAQLVQDLLAGKDVSSQELGHELDQEHVAVIATGADPVTAVRALATAFDRQALIVRSGPNDTTAWAWLSGRRAPLIGPGDPLSRFRPPAGTTVAIGDPGEGTEGFRRSHADAAVATRFAGGQPVTRYRDIATEALVSEDRERAQRFVTRELAPLGRPDERGRVLRTTLRAYFETGHNARSAAARLCVAERTLRYRLRAIEQALGRPIGDRRAELELALRLEDRLGAEIAPAADLARAA
jgi:hypothetical protein